MRAIRGGEREERIEADSIHELIGLLYQAAVDFQYWPLFLQRLAAVTDPSFAASWTRDFQVPVANPGLVLIRRQTAHSDRFGDLYELLAMHFQRAEALQRRMLDLESRAFVFEQAMNHVSAGIIVVSRRLHVFQLNEPARRILELQDGLIHLDGKLTVQNPDELFSLRSAVMSMRDDSQAEGVAWVSRSAGKRPLGLVICGLRAKEGLRSVEVPAAVLYLSDPDSGTIPDPSALQRIYRFTKAESMVALQLLQGKNVEACAGTLNISVNTARTHLKRLLQKTQTSRQADLIRLLLTGPATLRR